MSSPTSSTAIALAEDLILTDDYYATVEPSQWKGNELYVPHFAIGRLVQTPAEIITQIDHFRDEDVINPSRALVTGYDFVQDSALLIRTLIANDTITPTVSPNLIGPVWNRDDFVNELLGAGKRHELISINGHETHTSLGVP